MTDIEVEFHKWWLDRYKNHFDYSLHDKTILDAWIAAWIKSYEKIKRSEEDCRRF